MYSLPNQPVNTSDNYQYFKCPRGARFTIQAFGSNPVDIGIGRGYPAPQYTTADVYLAQTTWVDSLPVDEIRFKSHVAGKPGQIAITVMTIDEVGGQPAPGGLFPNYLSLNPDGTLDATFSGHVTAKGIDLPEADFAIGIDPDNLVRWLDSGGVEREGIYGLNVGGTHQLFARADGGAGAVMLIDENQMSKFLQLIAPFDKCAINWGAGVASFVAATSVGVAVNHGMGVIPDIVLVCPQASFFAGGYDIVTNANFTAFITHIGGVFTGDINFSWLAIAHP